MKIAFFTDSYLPNKDGVVVSLLNLKKYLEKRRHKVYIFTPSPTGYEFEEDGIFYFKSAKFPPYPQYRISFPNFPKVVSIAESLDIDVVHNHGIALTSWASLSVSRELGINALTTFHTDITKATHYISNNYMIQKASEKIAWSYLKFLYSKFNVVTAPSLKSIKELKSHGINAVYLPNGITLPKIKIKNLKKRKDNDYLLHVGRVVKEKEIDFIFPCIKKYNLKHSKKMKLFIVGSGPAMDYYKIMVDHYGIKEYVDFLGFVSNSRLSKLYRNARALVFTSRFDTQGLVVLEALSRATPILYRKGTAAEEIAKPLNLGFSSCNSFFRAYSHSEKIPVYKCLELSKKFDIKNVGKRLEHLYKFLK